MSFLFEARLFASDIETCKHVSASLGSNVILEQGEAAAIESKAFKKEPEWVPFCFL
jgi:hypothetical protein